MLLTSLLFVLNRWPSFALTQRLMGTGVFAREESLPSTAHGGGDKQNDKSGRFEQSVGVCQIRVNTFF